jgi:hypothetical protein
VTLRSAGATYDLDMPDGPNVVVFVRRGSIEVGHRGRLVYCAVLCVVFRVTLLPSFLTLLPLLPLLPLLHLDLLASLASSLVPVPEQSASNKTSSHLSPPGPSDTTRCAGPQSHRGGSLSPSSLNGAGADAEDHAKPATSGPVASYSSGDSSSVTRGPPPPKEPPPNE